MNSVSIIVTCEEQQSQLRQLLPGLLSLQYGGEYEVIVVDKTHDKDLAEWLKEMKVHYPHLCHTFCSKTASIPPKMKRGGGFTHRLALMLGAKAACYDWLLLLPSRLSAYPLGEHWISRLVENIGEKTDVVVGRTGRRHWWHRLTFNLFRRKFPIFRPTSSIILCRRSILLQTAPFVPTKRVIYQPL
ncbi:MAG: hypothetical protein IKP36_11245 [Bacteroidaceae bacterium]|nr:hypothetical protein [Bacteroidaceae bacterium]